MARILLICLFFLKPLVFAEEAKVGQVTGLPIPRFLVLKSKKVNMRSGPGLEQNIKITYQCSHLPVEVLGEFDNWRLVRDFEGNDGWIHEAMLSKKNYAQIILDQDKNEYLFAYRLPDPKSQIIAKIQPKSLVKVLQCREDWCKVSFGKKGWVPKKNLWGPLAG